MHMSGSSVPGLCTFREDKVHTNLMNALYTHTHSQMHDIYLQTKQLSASTLKAKMCKTDIYIQMCFLKMLLIFSVCLSGQVTGLLSLYFSVIFFLK